MPKKKRNKKRTIQQFPSGIKITDISGEFRFYKIYRKRIIEEPFFISDELVETVEYYQSCIKKWKIEPDLLRINELIEKYK